MIRVLHYLPNLGLGGTEKTCELFLYNLSVQFQGILAYPASKPNPRLSQFEMVEHVKNNIRLVPMESADDLPAVIAEHTPDILHVYRSGYQEFPEPGVHVHVPHFVETNVFGFIDPNPKVSRTLYMSKWLMDYSLRQFAQPFMPAKRFDFVNNPVEEPVTGGQLSFQIPNESIVLGRCGRPDNGIYNAVSVHAANILKQQGYPIHFLVVAPPSNMLADLADYGIPFHVIPPTVHPTPLSQFYNTIDIYAHARADGETFGVNIAEAMMHGKPVVTHWAVPSNPGMGVFQSQTELVDNDKTGYVVENDPEAYAEALKKLIDEPSLRVTMGAEGARKAHAEYHAKVCTEKLESIYRGVMTDG